MIAEMICIFDMGGVLVRNHNVFPALSRYLGFDESCHSFADFGKEVSDSLRLYSEGRISENEFWTVFSSVTGKHIEDDGESLFGRFFKPVIDDPTEAVIKELKGRGIRVVCGTNVIKEHYDVHIALSQYCVFDKVYPSFRMHLNKPDQEFFRYIIEKEGVLPEECFFTDDLIDNVASAESVGMHSYLYSDAETLEKNLRKEKLL